jgi:alanyl aminopeptidase
METFIEQAGIPMVHVDVTGPNTVRLSQERFMITPTKSDTWRIPVILRYSDGTTTRTKSVMLDKASTTVQLEGGRVAWLYPHANASGYYRWQLDPASMTALASQATEVLSPRERLAFLGNLGALFRAGKLSGDVYMDHISRFANDEAPAVIEAVLAAVGTIRSTFDTPELRPRFAEYVRRTLGPAMARVGFTPKEGEPQPLTGLRPDILYSMAMYGQDESVWQFVNEQLPKYLQDPKSLHPTLAGTVVGLSGTRGDATLFEEYRKRFENATLPNERSRFLGGLGSFRDPALKQKAREYALGSTVRPTEVFNLVGGGGDTEEARDEMYRWVTENYDALAKKLPPTFSQSMPFIAGGCDPARVERARAFFAEHKVQGTERSMARVAEQVKDCAALRAREMDAVVRYLTK